MMLEEGLRAFLLQADLVRAITSHCYTFERPQNTDTLPDILMQRTGTQYQEKLCGVDDLATAEIQIDSYGISGTQAAYLARAVRKTLNGFTSSMMGDVYVDKVFAGTMLFATDPEPGTNRVVQLFTFWYQEEF